MNKPEKDFNSTYSLNSSKPEELTKSFLGDLPPLGASSGPKNSSLSLAPLKRIPPVAKVEATKKEGKTASSNNFKNIKAICVIRACVRNLDLLF